MYFSKFVPIVLCLTASTLASPLAAKAEHTAATKHKSGAAAGAGAAGAGAGAVSEGIKTKVTGQINKWLDDIKAVNNFVDTVSTVKDLTKISSMASTALVAAQNEGDSLTILQQDVKLDESGQAAAKALAGQFGIIGPAIKDTISNPGNLQKNLDAINGARCPPPRGGNAISQEGAVQAAAASAVGAKVDAPQTPAACATPAPAVRRRGYW